MVEWKEFDKFERLYSLYFVRQGEGETMASQAVIAMSKLVYKWYNDGDVYDNRYFLEGWWNDLSTYANWLYNRCSITSLASISDCRNGSEYEELLFKVASELTPEFLEMLNKKEKVGSIYTEQGPFEFIEFEEDEDDW